MFGFNGVRVCEPKHSRIGAALLYPNAVTAVTGVEQPATTQSARSRSAVHNNCMRVGACIIYTASTYLFMRRVRAPALVHWV